MIKVGILGTGAISDSHILSYLKFQDRCQIAALVDLYPDKAEKKAHKYNLNVPISDDYISLSRQVELDLVSICLPPFAHAEAAIAMLDAGVHVLTEKPMATSLDECDRMIEAADKNGRLLSVVAQNRFQTPSMKIKSVLDSGLTGGIVHAQVDSFWWRGDNYYKLWWRGTWDKEGGGCTMNHAVHHIDLFQWMMGGSPAELQAVVSNLNHRNSEVEDFSTAVLFYADGRIGQITASLVHHGEEQQMVFQGTRASVRVPWRVSASKQRENGFPDNDPEHAEKIEAYYAGLPEVVHTLHDGQINNVLNAIDGEEALLIDGREGRKTLEIVTAIYQSGVTGKRVKLPLGPDDPFYSRQGVLQSAPHFYEKGESVENFASEDITFGRDFKEAGS